MKDVKFSILFSWIAIFAATLGAIITLSKGEYFRCFLLSLFIVMQCDVLAIRQRIER
jgi:hypothetical protein